MAAVAALATLVLAGCPRNPCSQEGKCLRPVCGAKCCDYWRDYRKNGGPTFEQRFRHTTAQLGKKWRRKRKHTSATASDAAPVKRTQQPPPSKTAAAPGRRHAIQSNRPAATPLLHECVEHPQPNGSAPLFFLHLPKTGGTTIRHQLVRDARSLKLTHFAPCHNGVACSWWSARFGTDNATRRRLWRKCPWNSREHPMPCLHPKVAQSSAVVAGHFGVSLMDTLAPPRAGARRNCLVAVRHPLERLLSCHAFFHRSSGGQFTSLSLKQQRALLSACGGNAMTAYYGGGSYDSVSAADNYTKLPPSGGTVARAERTVDECFVVLMERWSESHLMLRAAFAWSTLGAAETLTERHQTSKHAGLGALKLETRKWLVAALRDDLAVYEHAVRKFAAQMECFIPNYNTHAVWRATLALRIAALHLGDDYINHVGMQRGGWGAVLRQLIEQGVIKDTHSKLDGTERLQKIAASGGITFISSVERFFAFGPSRSVSALGVPWIGVVHFVGELPVPPYRYVEDTLEGVVTLPSFQRSLPHCLMLIAMSETSARQLRPLVAGVSVHVLMHPLPEITRPFELREFERARSTRRLVLVGAQYRMIRTIWALQTRYPRLWLPGRGRRVSHKLFERFVLPKLPSARYEDVNVTFVDSWDEYDHILRSSVVVIDLVGASANNAVLECIAAHIPCFIRRLSAVEEYIGPGYPNFFDEVGQLEQTLNDASLLQQRVEAGHRYLRNASRGLRGLLSVSTFGAGLETLARVAVVKPNTEFEPWRVAERRKLPPLLPCSLPVTEPNQTCGVQGNESVRVALCFWGFAGRSMPYTLDALRTNVVGPLKQFPGGALDIFVHALTAPRVQNSHRSKEGWRVSCSLSFLMLEPCSYGVSQQHAVDLEFALTSRVVKSMQASEGVRHPYNDEQTLLNIYRSRYSLSQVGKLVRAQELQGGFEYVYVVAVRPDTTFLAPIPLHSFSGAADIWVGSAQSGHARRINFAGGGARVVGGGINDRFAFGRRGPMLRAYMTQFDEQLSARRGVRFVDSEHLLCLHLTRTHNVSVGFYDALPVFRVRASGALAASDVSQNVGPERASTTCRGSACCQPEGAPVRAQVRGVRLFHGTPAVVRQPRSAK